MFVYVGMDLGLWLHVNVHVLGIGECVTPTGRLLRLVDGVDAMRPLLCLSCLTLHYYLELAFSAACRATVVNADGSTFRMVP